MSEVRMCLKLQIWKTAKMVIHLPRERLSLEEKRVTLFLYMLSLKYDVGAIFHQAVGNGCLGLRKDLGCEYKKV
jgi:hypothetical protein